VKTVKTAPGPVVVVEATPAEAVFAGNGPTPTPG
jgi:hypothetical protein